MRTLDLRGQQLTRAEIDALIPRTNIDIDAAVDAAREIVRDVKNRGADALREQAQKFDGLDNVSLRVPAEQIAEAAETLSPALRAALTEAIRRVRAGSAAQVPPAAEVSVGEGATIRQRWVPVERVGVYVPGGKAVYPSSVIMNVVAAQAAGVTEIALASPGQAALEGRVHHTILAAADMLGVSEVYAMGGAGAIGAFAYGVPEIGLAPVNVITGPGNLYVAAAKRSVRGVVGIDSEAGPTEILVIADSTGRAKLIAADLISQAEHDELASAVLVTTDTAVADAVQAELALQAAKTEHSERVSAALAGEQSAIVLVDTLEQAVMFANAYGAEHLEIHTEYPQMVVRDITNAGAIFLGANSPVSLGDYLAGSNHVLPTAGQAAFSSGLGAYTFLRAQQVVEYSADALREVQPHIRALSNDEDLPAHGDAVDVRFEQEG